MDTERKPRIAIVGAGAVGSLLGGMLARKGEDVTLIGRKDHVEAIQKNGLTVNGVAGDFNVKVNAAESLDFSPDMVFVAVKTQDVEETCKLIRPHIGDIPVIMMQNGVISSEIAGSILGKEKIISCIFILSVQFQTPGVINFVNENPIVVGEAFGENGPRIQQVQALLKSVTRTEISDNIIEAQWSKLFINIMTNALDGMTGLSLGEYIKYQGLMKIGILIVKEALELMNKAGIRMEPLPAIPLAGLKIVMSLPIPVSVFLMKLLMKLKGDDSIVSSTLQSLRKGKITEIDFLNGEFVRLGEKIGVPAPYNAKVVELVHNIEKSGSFYSPQELEGIFSKISS